jgi:putative MATE family efflux protein
MSLVQDPEKATSKFDLITEGPIGHAIWQVSWPLAINMLSIATTSFIEIWIAGRFGSDSQAAIGFGFQIWHLLMLLATAMSVAATALISRSWGAGDRAQAIEAARQSLLFAILSALTMLTLGLIVTRPILSLLGASPAVKQLAWDYLKILFFAQPGWNLIWIGNSIFRAQGHTKIPMFTWLFLTATMASLDCLFCLYPFHFGITGIATGSVIAATLGGCLNLFKLHRSELGDCVAFFKDNSLKNFMGWAVRLLKIGLPACIQDITWLSGTFFILFIFAQVDHASACQAAWAVGFRLEETFAVLPVIALHIGIGTIVGQNLGAGRPERAQAAGWKAAGVGFVINLFVGGSMFFWAKDIATAMTPNDQLVIDYTTQYLRIIGPTEPLTALWLILFGALQGAGYTRWPMWATAIAMLGFRLPLAWFLTTVMKIVPSGVWLAWAFTAIIVGLLAVNEFHVGKWKLQKV